MNALALPVPEAAQRSSRRSGGQIRTVLLATDFSASSTSAALYAMDLASQLDARLLITSAIEAADVGGVFTTRVDQLRSHRERHAQALVARARAAGAHAAFLIWQGEAGPTIVSAADAEHADLIVIGTRGREGVTRLLLGSVSDYVVRHARCPVMVVQPAQG